MKVQTFIFMLLYILKYITQFYRPFPTCFLFHTRHDMAATSMILCYRVLVYTNTYIVIYVSTVLTFKILVHLNVDL